MRLERRSLIQCTCSILLKLGGGVFGIIYPRRIICHIGDGTVYRQTADKRPSTGHQPSTRGTNRLNKPPPTRSAQNTVGLIQEICRKHIIHQISYIITNKLRVSPTPDSCPQGRSEISRSRHMKIAHLFSSFIRASISSREALGGMPEEINH